MAIAVGEDKDAAVERAGGRMVFTRNITAAIRLQSSKVSTYIRLPGGRRVFESDGMMSEGQREINILSPEIEF
jgi:hypothetical protein